MIMEILLIKIYSIHFIQNDGFNLIQKIHSSKLAVYK